MMFKLAMISDAHVHGHMCLLCFLFPGHHSEEPGVSNSENEHS